MKLISEVASVLVLLSMMGVTRIVSADNWPGWRGPHHNGHCDEDLSPTAWIDNLKWKVKVPGKGYSSPIVWDDAIFLTTSQATSETDRTLVRMNRQGQIVWKTKIYDSPVEEMHRLNSPASATPVTNGELVFLAFSENDHIGVAAVNFSGEIVWKTRPGIFVSRHGFHSCPLLYKNTVIINGEQDSDDAFVAALDCKSGDIVWKQPRDIKIRSFSAPFLLRVGNVDQIIVSGAEQTVAYNASSGSPIWQTAGPAQKTVSSIVSDGKLVFVPGGRENLLLAIDPTGTGDITKTHVRWRATKGIPYVPSPIFAGGLLHVMSDDGVYSIYTADGKLKVQHRLCKGTSSSLVAMSNVLVVSEDNGTTYVLTNDGSGTVLRKHAIGETVYASPAISNGDLFLRSTDHLYCFGADIQHGQK